jgi:two-component system sensor histidine kinase YesM
MKSLRNELMLSFIIIIVVAIVPSTAFSYFITEELVESRMSKTTLEILGQLGNGLNMILSDTRDLSLFTISDHNVRGYLKTKAQSDDDGVNPFLDRMNETFTSLISYKPYIVAINIYGDNGLTFELSGPSHVIGDLPQEKPPQSGLVISHPYRRYYYTVGEQYVLSFSRQIKDINALSVRLGSLRFDISEAEICKLYRNVAVGNDGCVFIAGTDGVILSHRDKSMLSKNVLYDELLAPVFHGGSGYYRKTIDGKRMMVAYDTNPDFNIVSVSVINLDEFLTDAFTRPNTLFIVFALPFALAILLAVVISGSVSKAIRQLTGKMSDVENGNLDVQLTLKRKDEIGALVGSFNHMVRRLKSLVDEVYVSHIKRKEAELHMLEAQINPHFLYNTLNSIYWMARIEEAEKTQKAIIALSKFYRHGLSHGQTITSVRHELDFLENYLYIQMLTCSGPPRVTVDVEPKLYSCKVSMLLLQPIVENALLHGVSGMGAEGRVTLTGRDTGETMEFIVEDNGVGMSPERIDEIIGPSTGKAAASGLRNVDERIKLYFGDEYGISIESIQGGGTRVSVRLPKR